MNDKAEAAKVHKKKKIQALNDGASSGAKPGDSDSEEEIDFKTFFQVVKNLNVNFVPEIWNGHLDDGKGFKKAMFQIEKIVKKISVKKNC